MTKTILAVSIATILVTGLISFSSLVLAAEPGDQYRLQTKKSDLCNSLTGENCGKAQMKGKLLVNSSTEGVESGVAQLKVDVRGIPCENESQRCSLISGNIPWTLDKTAGTFTVPDKMWEYQNGEEPLTLMVELDGSNYQDKNQKRGTLDLSYSIFFPNGTEFQSAWNSAVLINSPLASTS